MRRAKTEEEGGSPFEVAREEEATVKPGGRERQGRRLGRGLSSDTAVSQEMFEDFGDLDALERRRQLGEDGSLCLPLQACVRREEKNCAPR